MIGGAVRLGIAAAALAALSAPVVGAQPAPPPQIGRQPGTARTTVVPPPLPQLPQTAPVPVRPIAPPRTILFIGNSFTQGAHSPVRNWDAGRVTDLAGGGIGGVPALVRRFAVQAGLDYRISLETQGGKSLGFHFEQRRQLFDRAWDVVVLQEHSTLDPRAPGDPTNYRRDVGRLTGLFRARNPRVRLYLMPTWSRADLVYRGQGRWANTPIARMANDLDRIARQTQATTPGVTGIVPVGETWNRAFASGVADPDPYDGIAFGQIDLWSYDHYHASTAGYYLEALVAFGRISGIDPRTLGPNEHAADTLGLSSGQATALQRIAAEQLAAEPR